MAIDLTKLTLFQAEEHQPFTWRGGHPAALLIHGFPGTPKEMRPLAGVLQDLGWTTQGLLLPGFGPQIDRLFDQSYQDWIAAALQALTELKRHHDPVLLVGYSMGSSVAIKVAAAEAPDGLILCAPFWGIDSLWQNIAWRVFRLVFRTYRPFSRASFDNPRFRQGISEILPGVDLDSPAVREELRALRVPSRVLDQVLKLGRDAGNSAREIRTDVLVLQGLQDPVVKPKRTQRLIQRFPGPVRYQEFESNHDLISLESPTWPQLAKSVQRFAEDIQAGN